MRTLFALLCLLLPAQAQAFAAEDVVADLSQNRVSINTSFDGSEILVFGAVKRSRPVPIGTPPLEVIITVSGPSEPVTVRKKDRRLGIWVNTESVEIDAAPSFYAVATSGAFGDVLTETEDQRHKVSVAQAIRSVGAPASISDAQSFTEALMRIRANNDLYVTAEGAVELVQETLFNTEIRLPANLVEGSYETRIFLTRGGEVTATYNDVIEVSKVGLERFIYNLAHEQPLAYGLLSLFIAISAGWMASAIFRFIR
jgi:uncharacterized protein (TIGR02186 family)